MILLIATASRAFIHDSHEVNLTFGFVVIVPGQVCHL